MKGIAYEHDQTLSSGTLVLQASSSFLCETNKGGGIFLLYNSFIPYTCEIGKGTKFAYKGMGVVIHSNAVIGENCIIAQQVTVGGKSKQKNVPHIGDNVYIGAGAKVLGDITIGNDVVIGAGAVVINNVQSNCAVAGVPARVIREGITMQDLV